MSIVTAWVTPENLYSAPLSIVTALGNPRKHTYVCIFLGDLMLPDSLLLPSPPSLRDLHLYSALGLEL